MSNWTEITSDPESYPLDYEDVLVVTGGDIQLGYWNGKKWTHSDITHWMPLPDLPTPKNQEAA